MIYFVQRQSDRAIKIGTTVRLSQRLRAFRVEHGNCEVLAVMDGSYADESVLHKRFRSYRRDGEWFADVTTLRDFMAGEGRPWDGVDEAESLGSAKLRMEVIESARIVAAYRGESMTDLLSNLLRPVLARMEYEMTKADKPAKPKGGKH